MTRNAKSNPRRTRKVMPVQVLDAMSGLDGAKVDRVISQVQNSEGQTRVILQSPANINSATSQSNQSITFNNIVTFDDFVSMAAQFSLFRVAYIRFDIYDVNPGNTAPAIFATTHQQGNLVVTLDSVADRPDSAVVPPGTGKLSLTWVAHGSLENQFQSTSNFVDYGGLVTNVFASQNTGVKYLVLVKAVVDFRGRI